MREYQKAIVDAESSADLLELKRASDVAKKNADILREMVNANIAELMRQREDIDSRIAGWRDNEAAKEARELCAAANKAFFKAKSDAIAEVDAKFSDIADHAQFYVASWTPQQSVLDAMEEVRRMVLQDWD